MNVEAVERRSFALSLPLSFYSLTLAPFTLDRGTFPLAAFAFRAFTFARGTFAFDALAFNWRAFAFVPFTLGGRALALCPLPFPFTLAFSLRWFTLGRTIRS